MKIVVDKSKCTGHARCAATAPEVYGLDDLGYVEFSEKEVPAGSEDTARAGAAACPERAITLL
jgi:ferredoxin